ncbi:MAG: nucleoside triphosphate pyrophosphohydrolase [Deltaproteobacteria bacterium]
MSKNTNASSLEKLLSVMDRLRSDSGCPWDREQTIESLTPFITEEAYEVVGAIEEGSAEDIKEELGDLLFQIVFVCRIMKEKGLFDIYSVMEGMAEKMIRRHPHVFGEAKAKTSKDVLNQWAKIKRLEGKEKSGYLSDVSEAYPALMRAHKIAKKAAKAGFDWKDIKGVMKKLNEELNEFKEALKEKNRRKTEEELGDVLFTLVNVGRFVEVNPEEALRKTIGKFVHRFHYVEKKLKENGKELVDASMGEMEKLWQEAKKKRRKTR